MRQSKICQQPECKRILNSPDEKGPRIRCKDCHTKSFEKSISDIQQKKIELLIKKEQLQKEFQDYYNENKQKWDAGVEQSLNAIKIGLQNEKYQKLQHTINIRKRTLAKQQEELDDHKKLIDKLQLFSKSIQEKYYNLKQSLQKKQNEIQKKEQQYKFRQYIIFAQLPFLFDNHMIYNQYKINEEIQEIVYDTIQELVLPMRDDILISTSFFNIDYEQLRLSTTKINTKNGEICLTLKKSPVQWKEYFHDNAEYYENFITSIIKVYKLIYYMGNLFNVVLPYVIYIDNRGYPQFLEYQIFTYKRFSNLMDLKESSLSQMQINIYYLKYYFNLDIQDKLYSFFDIIDLLQSYYEKFGFQKYDIFKNLIQDYIPSIKNPINKQQYSNQQKRKPIPIKLVQTQCPKFLLQYQISEQQISNKMDNSSEFSDVEFIQ
ncbi:unnamed protein product [Paramecium primaurelia]|uniref:Uncharacterized protein n=1 Tax=Paramecium primaurelia TaxID=5886 RepID=A0A8S1N5A9_PARPR|nr:unnamed protein product [Paramecium primaurelia]